MTFEFNNIDQWLVREKRDNLKGLSGEGTNTRTGGRTDIASALLPNSADWEHKQLAVSLSVY